MTTETSTNVLTSHSAERAVYVSHLRNRSSRYFSQLNAREGEAVAFSQNGSNHFDLMRFVPKYPSLLAISRIEEADIARILTKLLLVVS